MDSLHSPTAKPLYWGARVIWYLFWILETILIFRFILKFLDANPGAAFTDFVYDLSAPLVAPFIGVFSPTRLGDIVIEWASLLALLVYWFVALAIIRLFLMGDDTREREVIIRETDDAL